MILDCKYSKLASLHYHRLLWVFKCLFLILARTKFSYLQGDPFTAETACMPQLSWGWTLFWIRSPFSDCSALHHHHTPFWTCNCVSHIFLATDKNTHWTWTPSTTVSSIQWPWPLTSPLTFCNVVLHVPSQVFLTPWVLQNHIAFCS